MTLLSLLTLLIVSHYLLLNPDFFFPEQRTVYIAYQTVLFTHVAGGMVALALGPLSMTVARQFWRCNNSSSNRFSHYTLFNTNA